MTLSPFAALESRLNSAVFKRLANAEVSVNGAEAVGGIFDNGYAVGAVGPLGMGGTQPSVVLMGSAVPAQPVGLTVSVSGVDYVIANAEPDGAGTTRLLLEAAQ